MGRAYGDAGTTTASVGHACRRELQAPGPTFRAMPSPRQIRRIQITGSRRGCTLQGKGARPLPGNRRWPARRTGARQVEAAVASAASPTETPTATDTRIRPRQQRRIRPRQPRHTRRRHTATSTSDGNIDSYAYSDAYIHGNIDISYAHGNASTPTATCDAHAW